MKHSVLRAFYAVPLIVAISCGKPTDVRSNKKLSLNGLGEPATLMNLQGGGKGNGGDAVVCFSDSKIKEQVRSDLRLGNSNDSNPFANPEIMKAVSSVQLLDLYEYELPSGFPPKRRELLSAEGSFQQMIPKLIARFKDKSAFAAKLNETYRYLPLDHWHAAPGVVEISDSAQAVLLPSECLLIQAAARTDNQIYYDEYLWSRLDEINHAALVMHELIYKIAADHGDTNSQNARRIVGLTLSKSDVETLDGYSIYKQLKPIGEFPFSWQIEGNTVEVLVVSKEGESGLPQALQIKPTTIKTALGTWSLHERGPDSLGSSNLELDSAGLVTSLFGTPISHARLKFDQPALVTFKQKLLQSIWFRYDNSGSVAIQIDGRKWMVERGPTATIIFDDDKLQRVTGSTTLSNHLGDVIVEGNITLGSNGLSIESATKGQFQLNENSVLGWRMTFDKDMQLVAAESVSDSFSSYCNTRTFAKYITFELCGQSMRFYPSGRISQIEFSTRVKIPTVRLAPFKTTLQNVRVVEIEENSEFKRATFDANGLLKEDDNETKPVPNKSVSISNGKLVIED